MSAELEALKAEFEKVQAKVKQAETRFSNVEQMQTELTALESRAASPDGSVTVVAGPGGAVKDIRLTAEALRQEPGTLSATIMTTLRQAVADAAYQQAGLVDAHLGSGAFGDLSAQDRVLEAQAEALGTTVDELRPKKREAPSPDEDFSQSSVFGSDEKPAPPPPSSGSAGDQFLSSLFDDQDDQEGHR
ncbi:YbaB/EbfC family nucleoid-associated protein [Amycolatopsis sp. CA-230715]|uniref:YbaB/EbfC family nucleoid-associated protein n=1 Tax=Amycolatopsis sp. CA-230715 TaxID=2745196 RepID=UPI001C0325E3|nr:YbaB/EbfC family nucleoid-associated protein [Amycolatopsis sp. CA-230715]QWF79682.1 hypothetical protein HUW46_03091 [Amycolatopsis sp. CA-230715]